MSFSREVQIGGFDHIKAVVLGGGNPVVIQTMWKDRLLRDDLDTAALRIEKLGRMGCGLLRFAVPALEDADILGELARRVSLPLVADIHFDYKIALRCLDFPIAKIRINPGNIGAKDRVKAVLEKAAEKGRPIRIGVNAGSLEKPLLEKYGHPTAEALVESAEGHIALLESLGFSDIVVSMKSSDIAECVAANRLFRARHPYPLHIGITEAGSGMEAVVRSSVGIGALLLDGIGETIRVSLTGPAIAEIEAAKAITACLGLRDAVTVVSCPTCARTKADVAAIAEAVKAGVAGLKGRLKLAVMGCSVNGPGEAREADIGIACATNTAVLFSSGEKARTVPIGQAAEALIEEAKKRLA